MMNRPYTCTLRHFWSMLMILFLITILILIYNTILNPIENSNKKDYHLSLTYEQNENIVREKWYSINDEIRWYNTKNISYSNPKLIEEVRKNWIVKTYNPTMPYKLESPEIPNPSMGQAQIIQEIFKDKKEGFFIECGAYDGETRSNTLVFERYYGWSGLLIEADPKNFNRMMLKNRNAYLSPTCLSIVPNPTIASFLMANNIGRIHDPTDSGGDEQNSPDIAHHGTHVNVQCFPLAVYVLALGIKSIDYFSLDVEGNEMEVLETIPFDVIDIKTLSVEFFHDKKEKAVMIDYMKSKGYKVYTFVERDDHLANDIIFVKNDLLLGN